EVTVLPGINPADRIIRNAINNRKKNHPMENDGFISKQYSKFTFDLDDATRKRLMDSSVLKKGDTTLLKMRQFFSNQYLFMIETASRHYFEPPYREKEIIDAYKVSGFTDPIFSTFAQEMQSFHFYDNQVTLLGKQYVNPIAFGSLNRYLFVLEDTTINNSDTTYTIFYRPRKAKNFDGLTGRLFINTNGFAIEKVTSSPFITDTSGIVLEIIQEYVFTENTKWFPSKLSTTIEIYSAIADVESGYVAVVAGDVKKPKSYIVGKGATYIENVKFNPKELEKERFNNVAIQTEIDADKVEESKWNDLRNNQLSKREKNTYVALDSIVKENKLDRLLKISKILATGKIPLGYINLDMQRIFTFNQFEGYRIGMGIETSEKLMKPVVLGGYIGYGFKDKAVKYGGYSTIHLHRLSASKIDLYYQYDVAEVGGFQPIKSSNFLNNELARDLFIQNMAYQQKYGGAISTTIRSNMELKLDVNRQHIQSANNYSYLGKTEFDALVSSFIWTWSIREKVNHLGTQRVPMGTKYPKLQVQFHKSWLPPNASLSANYVDFYRCVFSIQQNVPITGIGKLSWSARAGIASQNAPLFYQLATPATAVNWSISVPNTFETVGVNEFYHKKMAAVFARFTFNAIRTKAKWNQPQFGLHYAYGIGGFSNKSDHAYNIRSMDLGYHEAGIFINGILVSNNTSIGLGSFYRFGSYQFSDWKKNLVPKIVIGLVF
ncbi:MAG: hypothetical protein EBQ94_06260, partial [Flavobacteriales bacterium]|nr:hypothetical protein [Flavobacteriales bacterium]